ncbi:peptidoglycan-binding protein [Streptomyces sp. NPDC058867]|uniref:peptidoglycan-binding domain-containing protein n=1 Tax=unclassified Streptomyces TaxID=2593676 RepID=UPI0036A83663
MTGPKDHACPECGTPRGADNTPSCSCTERASEALRDAREAQAAAAEDFDPLRIRPYVELDGGGEPEPAAPAVPDAGETMPLRIPPIPPVPRTPEPSATDIRLFEAPRPDAAPAAPEPPTEEPARGRRRTLLLGAAAAAVIVVVGAAGMASGLFGYETPTRDTSRPEAVRASVPDTSPSPTTAQASSASPSPSASSASPSPSVSESPSASSASPSASASASPSPSKTSTPARASDAPPAQEEEEEPEPVVLRRGDSGPEVEELQLRLRQLWLYNNDINGDFTEGVEDALRNYQWSRGLDRYNLGVYTAETRASLESETSEP